MAARKRWEAFPGIRGIASTKGAGCGYEGLSFHGRSLRRPLTWFFCPILTGILMLGVAAPAVLSQNISGSVKGMVTDPTGAIVPNADVTLINAATSGVLKTVSNAAGLFVFPSVLPGSYTLRVQKQGFQQYERSGIELAASEIRDLGAIALTLGESRTTVSIVDTVVSLQMASGEKAGIVSGSQLNQLALKGRDFMSLVTLLPGVVDDGSQARNTASRSAFGGVYINGGRNDMKNFTVDGVTDVDTGSNGNLHYEPNMDSIAEVRVLVSNYQAEYGRSAAGLISVITKGGTQQFRGTGWWSLRWSPLSRPFFGPNKLWTGGSDLIRGGWSRPGHSGARVGARVAPLRCPILRSSAFIVVHPFWPQGVKPRGFGGSAPKFSVGPFLAAVRLVMSSTIPPASGSPGSGGAARGCRTGTRRRSRPAPPVPARSRAGTPLRTSASATTAR